MKNTRKEVECRSYNFKDANSGNNREKGKTLYIGLQSSPLYFCLYEKDKEQANRHQEPFEIRLRMKGGAGGRGTVADTEYGGFGVFYINGFVYFPDYPLWEIFVSRDTLPLEMNPQPVNMEHTLQRLEKQVMPSVAMLAKSMADRFCLSQRDRQQTH